MSKLKGKGKRRVSVQMGKEFVEMDEDAAAAYKEYVKEHTRYLKELEAIQYGWNNEGKRAGKEN